MTVAIRGNVYFDIQRIVAESPDKEVGGMVVEYQAGGILYQIHYHIPNVHTAPEHNYAGQAQATIDAYECTGVYEGADVAFAWHSHPTTPAIPSRIDKETYQPASVLLIVSAIGELGLGPEMRAWSTKTWEELLWVTF